MNKLVNRERLQHTINQFWEKVKVVSAQLNAENVFKRKNTFDDTVMIKRESMYIHSVIGAGRESLSGANKFVGCRSYTSHSNGNNGYVKAVKFRVKDDIAVGNTLRYIHLWAVEKKDSLAEDIVLEKINDPATYYIVKEEAGFGKYVEILVDKKFNTETYFVIGHGVSITYCSEVQESEDNVYGVLQTFPESGTGIQSTHRQYQLQYGLIGESMNLAVELEKLSEKANSSVSSVNQQRPNPTGDVTLGMNHIPGLQEKFNEFVPLSSVGNSANQIPQIGGTGKLDVSIMPDITITSVTVVNSESEAMDLSVQVGDVVIRTDEQGKAYICHNGDGSTFGDRFIGLGAASVSINTINNVAGIDGNVALALSSDGTSIILQANNQEIATLPIITDQEINDIINALS